MIRTIKTLAIIIFMMTNIAVAEMDIPVTIPIQRLSMEFALKAASAAIEACRERNLNVTVTVVDRGGHPQVVLRDTLAMDLSIPISKQKAYTAMVFNSPTSQQIGRFPGAYSVPKIDSVIISSGGLPITGGGSIIGGVGVSGAPSGITDEQCAQAGIDAIKFDLENI